MFETLMLEAAVINDEFVALVIHGNLQSYQLRFKKGADAGHIYYRFSRYMFPVSKDDLRIITYFSVDCYNSLQQFLLS